MSRTKENFFALLILGAFWGTGFYTGHTVVPPKPVTKTITKTVQVKVAACGEYSEIQRMKTKYRPQMALLMGAIPEKALRGQK